ncbi:MAG: hypothetical protein ABH882_01430 [Candidatus Omnitrophota bacterium]
MAKKRLLATICVVIALLTLYLIPFLQKKHKVNPDVFPTFRQIEKHCLDYTIRENVNLREYERCKKVNDLQKSANAADFYPAEKYYKILERLGFNLPSLYKE